MTRWIIGLFLWGALVTMLITIATNAIVVPMAHSEEVFATWYSVKSAQSEGTSGIWTASGERYDEHALTCALPHRRFGGWYRVCRADANNRESRCVVVRHNDYGPGKGPRSRGVVIDVSRGAFEQLATLREGKIAVTVEPWAGHGN